MANYARRPQQSSDTDHTRAEAEAQARAILARYREEDPAVSEPPPLTRPEPINRYIHPIPQSVQAGSSSSLQSQVLLEHILETLTRQNQLLLDLLAAINSLSAAILTPRPGA